jgi:hypothetical protein
MVCDGLRDANWAGSVAAIVDYLPKGVDCLKLAEPGSTRSALQTAAPDLGRTSVVGPGKVGRTNCVNGGSRISFGHSSSYVSAFTVRAGGTMH